MPTGTARAARPLPRLALLLALAVPASAFAQELPPGLAERLAPLLQSLARPAPELPAGVRFGLLFTGDVGGLAPGAGVTMHGLRVGTVRELKVTVAGERIEVPVVIDLVPELLTVDGRQAEDADALRAMVAGLVARGLRAQLAGTGLPGMGGQEIALDLLPDAPPAEPAQAGELPEIPTAPTRLDRLALTADRLLARVQELPLERLADEATATLASLHALVAGPELRQAVQDLAAAAGELRGVAVHLELRADPLIASLAQGADAAHDLLTAPQLRQSLDDLATAAAGLRDLPAWLDRRSAPIVGSLADSAAQAAGAAQDARRTMASLDATIGSRSNFAGQLQGLLRELTAATRSLRQLADQLDRQPDVLLRGRQGGPPP